MMGIIGDGEIVQSSKLKVQSFEFKRGRETVTGDG
jgi:hypothetical protein